MSSSNATAVNTSKHAEPRLIRQLSRTMSDMTIDDADSNEAIALGDNEAEESPSRQSGEIMEEDQDPQERTRPLARATDKRKQQVKTSRAKTYDIMSYERRVHALNSMLDTSAGPSTIAARLGVSVSTLRSLRKRYYEEGRIENLRRGRSGGAELGPDQAKIVIRAMDQNPALSVSEARSILEAAQVTSGEFGSGKYAETTLVSFLRKNCKVAMQRCLSYPGEARPAPEESVATVIENVRQRMERGHVSPETNCVFIGEAAWRIRPSKVWNKAPPKKAQMENDDRVPSHSFFLAMNAYNVVVTTVRSPALQTTEEHMMAFVKKVIDYFDDVPCENPKLVFDAMPDTTANKITALAMEYGFIAFFLPPLQSGTLNPAEAVLGKIQELCPRHKETGDRDRVSQRLEATARNLPSETCLNAIREAFSFITVPSPSE